MHGGARPGRRFRTAPARNACRAPAEETLRSLGAAVVVAIDAQPVHLALADHLLLADHRDVVLRLAGDDAGVAADAGVQVDAHGPCARARRVPAIQVRLGGALFAAKRGIGAVIAPACRGGGFRPASASIGLWCSVLASIALPVALASDRRLSPRSADTDRSPLPSPTAADGAAAEAEQADDTVVGLARHDPDRREHAALPDRQRAQIAVARARCCGPAPARSATDCPRSAWSAAAAAPAARHCWRSARPRMRVRPEQHRQRLRRGPRAPRRGRVSARQLPRAQRRGRGRGRGPGDDALRQSLRASAARSRSEPRLPGRRARTRSASRGRIEEQREQSMRLMPAIQRQCLRLQDRSPCRRRRAHRSRPPRHALRHEPGGAAARSRSGRRSARLKAAPGAARPRTPERRAPHRTGLASMMIRLCTRPACMSCSSSRRCCWREWRLLRPARSRRRSWPRAPSASFIAWASACISRRLRPDMDERAAAMRLQVRDHGGQPRGAPPGTGAAARRRSRHDGDHARDARAGPAMKR